MPYILYYFLNCSVSYALFFLSLILAYFSMPIILAYFSLPLFFAYFLFIPISYAYLSISYQFSMLLFLAFSLCSYSLPFLYAPIPCLFSMPLFSANSSYIPIFCSNISLSMHLYLVRFYYYWESCLI